MSHAQETRELKSVPSRFRPQLGHGTKLRILKAGFHLPPVLFGNFKLFCEQAKRTANQLYVPFAMEFRRCEEFRTTADLATDSVDDKFLSHDTTQLN
jgi:hypothetical protein